MRGLQLAATGFLKSRAKDACLADLQEGPPEAPTSWLQVGTSPPTAPDSQSTDSILGKSEHMAVTFLFFPNYVLGTEP